VAGGVCVAAGAVGGVAGGVVGGLALPAGAGAGEISAPLVGTTGVIHVAGARTVGARSRRHRDRSRFARRAVPAGSVPVVMPGNSELHDLGCRSPRVGARAGGAAPAGSAGRHPSTPRRLADTRSCVSWHHHGSLSRPAPARRRIRTVGDADCGPNGPWHRRDMITPVVPTNRRADCLARAGAGG